MSLPVQAPFHRAVGLGTLLLVAGVVVGSFLGGLATGAFTVTAGSETGAGVANPVSALTWWILETASTDVVPVLLPTSASTSATAPTVLTATNGSYALGAATAGHGAVRFDFQEKGAPTSTEVEFIVQFVNATGVAHAATVYFETQATSPSVSLLFSLYLDAGPAPAAFLQASELVEQCGSIGSCP